MKSLYINKIIILMALWLMGTVYLAAFQDNFYHRIYCLNLEIPFLTLLYVLFRNYKIKDVITSVSLLAIMCFGCYTIIDNCINTYLYFRHYSVNYTLVEDLYINPTHDNYISWYLAMSGVTAIISFFYITVNKR